MSSSVATRAARYSAIAPRATARPPTHTASGCTSANTHRFRVHVRRHALLQGARPPTRAASGCTSANTRCFRVHVRQHAPLEVCLTHVVCLFESKRSRPGPPGTPPSRPVPLHVRQHAPLQGARPPTRASSGCTSANTRRFSYVRHTSRVYSN